MQNFNPLTRRPVFNMDGVSRESRDYGMTADTVAGEAGPVDTSPASEFIARMRAERQNKPKPWQRRNPLIAKPIRYDDPKGGYQQPGKPDVAASMAGTVANISRPNDSIRYSQRNPLMR